MDNFIKRTISSLILVSFISFIIFFAPDWAFFSVIVLFVSLGLFEFFKLVEHRNIFVYKYFGTIVGAMIPVVIYLGYFFPELKNLEPLLIVVASLFAFILQFIRKDNARDHMVSMALTLFSLFYIGWFFSFFLKIRLLENGCNLVAYVIMVTKSADIGAYLIGSRVGKSELIPRISPKKTKEGTLGGIAVSVVLSMVLGNVLTGFSYIHLFVLGLLLATLGQVWDLAESLIKRDCNFKDSGHVFGGIGGILDLIDSLLFTGPIFYFYVKTF